MHFYFNLGEALNKIDLEITNFLDLIVSKVIAFIRTWLSPID